MIVFQLLLLDFKVQVIFNKVFQLLGHFKDLEDQRHNKFLNHSTDLEDQQVDFHYSVSNLHHLEDIFGRLRKETQPILLLYRRISFQFNQRMNQFVMKEN